MTAILEITDGTTTVSLLGLGNGFNLERWRPAIAQYKGRGTWQSSPMADGRRLVARQWSNALETFVLKVNNFDQDAVVRDTQDLRRLLEKAVNFWATDWQDTPVYIKAQATCETYPRYAIVKSWSTPDDENPFNQPFLQRLRAAVMDRWTLVIERSPLWSSNRPGTGTAVQTSAAQSYDGRLLGNVDDAGVRTPTVAREVYVANKYNEANLTDIYIEDNSVFGPNLMDAALPYNLLPPGGNFPNDNTYFGIDTSLADSGPFNNLVFDIGVAATYTTGFNQFQYWNGANWVELVVTDNTGTVVSQPFLVAGVNSVHWVPPSNWALRDLSADGGPAITGYWIRINVANANFTVPTQQNRDIYSIVWPRFQVAAAQLGGDVPCLARIKVFNEAGDDAAAPPIDSWVNRVVIGSRSVSRGADFQAFLNLSDEQNPPGVTAVDLAETTFEDDIEAPSGRYALYNPTTTGSFVDRVRINITTGYAPQYYGLFHCYLRAQQVGGVAGQITVRVTFRTGSGGLEFESDHVPTQNTNDWQLMDLGKIEISPTRALTATDAADDLIIFIETANTSTTPDLKMYDLILIPIDEWAGDFLDVANIGNSRIDNGTYLDLDSIVNPKLTRGVARVVATEGVRSLYRATINGPVSAQANALQRFWIVTERIVTATGSDFRSEPWAAYTVQLLKNQRYFSARGDR